MEWITKLEPCDREREAFRASRIWANRYDRLHSLYESADRQYRHDMANDDIDNARRSMAYMNRASELFRRNHARLAIACQVSH